MEEVTGLLNNLTKAKNRIEKNTTDLATETARATAAEQSIANDLGTNYVTKSGNTTPLTESSVWEVTQTGALQRTVTKRNIATGQTATSTEIPVPVTNNNPRLMLPEEISDLEMLKRWYEVNVGNALNYNVDLSDIPADGNANQSAVQTYLTGKFNTASGINGNPKLDLTTLIDENTSARYVWYVNSNAWVQSDSATGAQATNETHDQNNNIVSRGTKGVIKGSDSKGKIFVEIDGTGSLVGYDELVRDIANNVAAILAEQTARQNADAALSDRIDAKYTKPTNGMPSTDFDSTVQASLAKADTALQSVPDASTTQKGVAFLGTTDGAARYGYKADVGLDNVDNTSDANKPISTAMQTALTGKQDKLSATRIANIDAVPNKANSSDVASSVADLQSQINTINTNYVSVGVYNSEADALAASQSNPNKICLY